MYFSEKEELIIKPFFDYLAQKKKTKDVYNMRWKNGTEFYAKIVSIEEFDNNLSLNDKNYEEFTGIIINIEKLINFDRQDNLEKEWLQRNHLILINYHNFPDEIYNSKGELISKRED